MIFKAKLFVLEDMVNFVYLNLDLIIVKSNYTVMVEAKKLYWFSFWILKTSQKLACDNSNSFRTELGIHFIFVI